MTGKSGVMNDEVRHTEQPLRSPAAMTGKRWGHVDRHRRPRPAATEPGRDDREKRVADGLDLARRIAAATEPGRDDREKQPETQSQARTWDGPLRSPAAMTGKSDIARRKAAHLQQAATEPGRDDREKSTCPGGRTPLSRWRRYGARPR